MQIISLTRPNSGKVGKRSQAPNLLRRRPVRVREYSLTDRFLASPAPVIVYKCRIANRVQIRTMSVGQQCRQTQIVVLLTLTFFY